MNESVFVALIGAFSALLGTIIGAVLSYYFNVRKMYKNKNADYCMRIFGIYNSAATEIISLLSANIPGRDVLIARFMGSIQSPMTKLALTLKAIAEAKEA